MEKTIEIRQIIGYQKNPLSSYKECFRMTSGDLPYKLMFDSLAKGKSVAIETASSTENTNMVSRAICWFLDVFPDSVVFSIAPKQSQLKNISWSKKFKEITQMSGIHHKYMLFVIEECTSVPQPILTAIKNICTGEFNVVLAVGNPDSQSDSLHTFAELNRFQHIR